jgi:hypothetical protein
MGQCRRQAGGPEHAYQAAFHRAKPLKGRFERTIFENRG